MSQTIGYPILLSLSATIEAKKKEYYNALKAGQSSNEITPWLEYFIDVILKAQDESEILIDFTLEKTKLFDCYKSQLNSRQLKAVNRMLEEGPKGFEGGMTTKYIYAHYPNLKTYGNKRFTKITRFRCV